MQTNQVIDAGKQLVKQINDDEVPDLAAGLAYRFLFALFPFAIFLAALAGFVAPLLGFGDPTSEIMGSLSDNLPPDVAQQIRPQLEAVLGDTRPGLLTIGAITALWAAQGGIASVQKSCGADAHYEKKVAANGKFFFNLMAANHQVIATSPMYASEQDRDAAIAAVKAGGATAKVLEPA